MNGISSALPGVAAQPAASVKGAQPLVPSATLPAPSSSSANSGRDTVGLSSGQSIMLSRLFHTTDPDAAGIYTPGSAPSSGSVYKFLTASDRDMLASVYEYARDNGIDPSNVDDLAFDLGCYRSHPASSYVDGVGNLFDLDGNPVVAEFSPDDEATAKRILTSKAMSDTAVPHDFLRRVLDPGLDPTHAVDLGFLEKVVYATSASGSDGANDPNAVLAPRPKERLAALQAAGLIPPAEQMRSTLMGPSASEPTGLDIFAAYASRITSALPFLSQDDKVLLGSLYASTAGKKDASSRRVGEIDKLARTLAALRASDYLGAADQVAKRARESAIKGRANVRPRLTEI